MSIETYNRILPEFKTYHEKVYNFVYKLSYKEMNEVPSFMISTIEFQKMQICVFWDDVYNNRMVEIQRTKGPIREYWNLERVPNSEKFKITHIHSKLEDYNFYELNLKHYDYYSRRQKEIFIENNIVLCEEPISDFFKKAKVLTSKYVKEVVVHTGVLYEETDLGKQFIAEMEKFCFSL